MAQKPYRSGAQPGL